MTLDATATLVDHDPVLLAFAEAVGRDDPVAVRGGGTRWDHGGSPQAGTRLIEAPSGIVSYAPEEMTVRVRAGTTVADLHAELAARGQRTALPERTAVDGSGANGGGTVGGAIAVGQNDIHTLRRGTLRSAVLQVRYVSAEGRIVNAGGPTVKNVTGFDLPRLMVGSLGTLGLIGEVILRTNPIPATKVWLSTEGASPFDLYESLLRPNTVLWNGTSTWILLEGHAVDIAHERSLLSRSTDVTEVEGPPPLPPHRWSLSPSDLRRLPRLDAGAFVSIVGVGLAFTEHPQPARHLSAPVRAIHSRMKANFDPTGRLNPGRDPARGDS
jgi:hypothetical protein